MDNIYDRNTRYRVMTPHGYEHFATWASAYRYAMTVHDEPDFDSGTVYIDKIKMVQTWEIDDRGEVESTYRWDK